MVLFRLGQRRQGAADSSEDRAVMATAAGGPLVVDVSQVLETVATPSSFGTSARFVPQEGGGGCCRRPPAGPL